MPVRFRFVTPDAAEPALITAYASAWSPAKTSHAPAATAGPSPPPPPPEPPSVPPPPPPPPPGICPPPPHQR
ncbi:unnamed protein product [Spirodela intermedia]|uniref:Uncharacterized protein n=1 Tax=Spirodela intermedia TaxID=51605 RepID=A0A7I8IV09_SPIIN|nr:unnamed protein product [Spirodela intermedia]CAA6660987.1 unnamed protein product [Spirodela intermedia]